MRDPHHELQGRDPELQLLCDALSVAATGRLEIVLVEGEPGIGKSRLLEEIHTIAQKRVLSVHAGRSEELDQARPFGAIADSFGVHRKASDPARVEIARLIAPQADVETGLDAVRDAGMQTRAVEAFVDLLEASALEAATLVTLDDLQWADPSTLITLLAVARGLPYLPLAVVVAFRPVPRAPPLASLIESLLRKGARHLVLASLEDEAVRGIVAQEVGAEPGEALLREAARAAGNPLFVTELIRALGQEEALAVEGGVADLTQAVRAPGLRLTILRRFAFLGERTLETLRLASILGSSFSLTDLAHVAGRDVTTVVADLDGAVRSAILVEADESRLRFRHDLIREVVYEDIPQPARKALHAETARRLAAKGAPALTVAQHFSIGAEPGDSAAASWLHRAARQVASSAPDSAAELMARALELLGAAAPQRAELEIDLLLLRVWTGRAAECERIARELLARPLEARLAYEARRVLVETLFHQDRWATAVAEAAMGAEAFEGRRRAKFLCYLAQSAAFVGDLERADAAAREARETAERLGDLELLAYALSDQALVAGRQGDYERGLDTSGQAVAAAERWVRAEPERLEAQLDLACALAQKASAHVAQDRLAEGRRIHDDALRRFDRLGSRAYLAAYARERPLYAFLAGDWDDAVTGLDAAAALYAEVDREPSQLLRMLAAVLALHRGELSAAERDSAVAAQRPGDAGKWVGWVAALVRGATDPAAGADLAAHAWGDLAGSRDPLFLPPLLIDGARLGAEAGSSDLCEGVAGWMETYASRTPAEAARAYALHARGIATSDSGTLVAAVEAFRRSSRDFARALACEDAAAALARHGPTSEAARLLEEALEIYQRAGAERDIAHATARLRALGVVRLRHQTRRRPATGWAALTATEREVVRFAAQGLTNPQIGDRLFVSRRTVQTHLTHVFAKLGISSRVELAAAVAAAEA